MKKHILYIIIGIALGTIPGFIIGMWGVTDVKGALIEGLSICLTYGGVPGAVGGWIGGVLIKKYWGAVLFALPGSVFLVYFIFHMG